jgi:anti-anti-sigma regulatory factor
MGNESSKIIAPVGRIGLEKAQEFKAELLDALHSATRVTLDLSRIDDVDLSFIQTVYAAKREALASSRHFALSGKVNESIQKLLLIGGFSKESSSEAAVLEAGLHNFPQEV